MEEGDTGSDDKRGACPAFVGGICWTETASVPKTFWSLGPFSCLDYGTAHWESTRVRGQKIWASVLSLLLMRLFGLGIPLWGLVSSFVRLQTSCPAHLLELIGPAVCCCPWRHVNCNHHTEVLHLWGLFQLRISWFYTRAEFSLPGGKNRTGEEESMLSGYLLFLIFF